ncbi:MAG: ATP-binding protein [Flavobacteriales bacterium]|nr:ATP-binding protein [Flavobacteriales bacterium]
MNEQFVQYIIYGGYPEAVFDPEVQREPGRFIRTDIIDKVLLRDLPSLYGIRDVRLNRFQCCRLQHRAGVASADSRRAVSSSTIPFPRIPGSGAPTAATHRQNAKHYQREHGFKAYLTNPSLRTAMFGATPSDEDTFGALAETAVYAQDITRPQELYYANWKDGRTQGEVDLVWLNARLKPVRLCEVKWSDRITEHPRELKSLLGFAAANKVPWGIVTTRTILDTRTIDGFEIRFVPTSLYSYHRGLRGIQAVNESAQKAAMQI